MSKDKAGREAKKPKAEKNVKKHGQTPLPSVAAEVNKGTGKKV